MSATGWKSRTLLAATLIWAVAPLSALARPIHVVVIGDNNIRGKGVAPQDAYPAQLERALRARGIDASVENAGRNGDTTTGVLARLDASVPSETDVAVVSVGVNDVAVHGVPAETSKANVREIAQRLRARGIEVVVLRTGGKFQGVLAARPEYHVEKGFGPPPGTTEWHLNAQGYAIVAERTLPRVLAAIEKARERRGP